MYGTAITNHPAGIVPSSTIAGGVAIEGSAVRPLVATSPAIDTLFAYQAARAESVVQARPGRDASNVKFTIEKVDGPVDELLQDDRVRQALDQVVNAAKDMNVREIEIKSFFPFFKEFAKPRAEAVKNFLVFRGIDKDVIVLTPRGVGYGSKHAALARSRSVVIEIAGTPKQDANPAMQAQSAERPARYLLA
ncbi:hypothetical protein [Bordetella genomosp. 11]|nr:hypothetical protein [Bordetella genomosp. 11]